MHPRRHGPSAITGRTSEAATSTDTSCPHGRDSPQLALGSCFTYFQHPFSRRKFFVDPKLREFFSQPFCNREVGNPTGAWQAGRHRRAHGEDIRLKSSASASEWHEYRGPRNPLILRDVSASFAGFGARSRVSQHRVPALASHARTFWRCISVDRH